MAGVELAAAAGASSGVEFTDEVVLSGALAEGVCVRPVLSKVTDTVTGACSVVPIPCGSTREDKCPSCAGKARRLRMQQCREGWHLTSEPEYDAPADAEDQADDGPEDEDEDGSDGRRSRSTRRRQDVPDLPRHRVDDATVGRVFTAPDGSEYRPSMFATLTLPSYGRVRSDGTPVDPGSYDYRRAALDALHFPKLVDRFWQNLRRAVGYRVQYFAAVEPQRRLAPHLHAAIRGAIPRALIRQVVAGTYHQVWWPAHDEPVYVDRLPVWDAGSRRYVDPDTGEALPTFADALTAVDEDPAGEPAHVLRFGRQTDLQGILGGTADADRRVGYLCKYLTKSIADAHAPDEGEPSARRVRHLERLHAEVRWLPCSNRCPNWLRYGVQPDSARPELLPGHCTAKAHRRDALGCGGRRVLVSRLWTGKTLGDHRADRAAIVRAVLAEAGIEAPEVDRCAADATDGEGRPRFTWQRIATDRPDSPSYRAVLVASLRERLAWRRQYEDAKERAGPELVARLSATAITGGVVPHGTALHGG